MKRSVVQDGLSACLMLLALSGALLLSAYRHSHAPAGSRHAVPMASHSPELSDRSHQLLPFSLGEERTPGRNIADHSRTSSFKSKPPAALTADEVLLLKDVPAILYAAAAPVRCLGLSPPDIVYPFHYFW